ncbi:MAG: response regulator [Gemmatimonadales bacterium]|nr:response regulator [Gemmatimonadales bacterium]
MARILIIDDDEVVRLTTGAILTADDHEVAYAQNGEIGVSMYAGKRFDAVVVDLIMPVKNGLRTIRELREMDPGVRVIAMTGTAPEDLDLAADLGAIHTLMKPIDAGRLRAAVDGLLESKQGEWGDSRRWE